MLTPTIASSAPIYFPWIILAPMVLTLAALSGCVYNRRLRKFQFLFTSPKKDKKLASSGSTESPRHLLVAIPTSSLLDDTQMTMVFNGERQKVLNRISLPPPAPTVTEMLKSSDTVARQSSLTNLRAPSPIIKRNSPAPEHNEHVNPELLLQLLHNQFHHKNINFNSPSLKPSNVFGSFSSSSPLSPSTSFPPSSAYSRRSFGLDPLSLHSDSLSKSSFILPDKTSLIRGNFDIPGIPKPLPNVSTTEYGARQLCAEWDSLYESVVSNCYPTSSDKAVSPIAYQTVGLIGSTLMDFVRRITSRNAGEQIWCPLIYAHHVEYKQLPKVKLLQPAEMYLAIYELLTDKTHSSAVQEALAPIMSLCVHQIRDLVLKKNKSAKLKVNIDNLNTFIQNLPWTTITTFIRAKRYRPTLSLFEVTGTGQRPESNWMTILNYGMSGRLDLNHSLGSSPETLLSLQDSAVDTDIDPFAVVSLPVWPGIVDLDECIVRIRARILISS